MADDGWFVPVYIRGNRGAEDYYGMALVDTGATHSLIPTSICEKLGLAVVGEREVQTANGYVEMPVVFGIIRVSDSLDEMGVQMLETPTGDLVAVGRDVIIRAGLLVPTAMM